MLVEKGKLSFISADSILTNPRNSFNVADIDDLSNSIRSYGLVTPLSVIGPSDDGTYMLISGERRLAAMKGLRAEGIPGFDTIPCHIIGDSEMDITEQELLIEVSNVDARNDINPQQHYMRIIRLLHELSEKRGYGNMEYLKLRTEYMKCSTRYARFYEQIFQSDDEELKSMVEEGTLSASRASRLLGMEDDTRREALREIREGKNQDEVVKKYKEKSNVSKASETSDLVPAETQAFEEDPIGKSSSFEEAALEENTLNEEIPEDLIADDTQDEIVPELDEDGYEKIDFMNFDPSSLSCDSTGMFKSLANDQDIKSLKRDDRMDTVKAWMEDTLLKDYISDEEADLLELCKKVVEKFL